MSEAFQFIPLVALAVCLSAACGCKIFLPPFILGLLAYFGYWDISDPNLVWLGSLSALIILGVATFVEICAYYIPYIDNLLDTIAAPAAVIAGVLLSSTILSNYDPAIKWGVAILAGGGASGLVQGSTMALRAASTGLTGGLGNFVVATFEIIFAILLTLFGVLLPVIGVLFVVGLLYLFYLGIKNLKNKIMEKKQFN